MRTSCEQKLGLKKTETDNASSEMSWFGVFFQRFSKDIKCCFFDMSSQKMGYMDVLFCVFVWFFGC